MIFILGKYEIFFYREALEFEHFSDEFPLEFSWDEVDMEVFDASICHGFPCTGEVITGTIESLHEEVNRSYFCDLFLIKLMGEGNMPVWNCHEVLMLSRIGENIADDIPVLPFPENIIPSSGKITEWTLILSENFISCLFIIIFPVFEFWHRKH